MNDESILNRRKQLEEQEAAASAARNTAGAVDSSPQGLLQVASNELIQAENQVNLLKDKRDQHIQQQQVLKTAIDQHTQLGIVIAGIESEIEAAAVAVSDKTKSLRDKADLVQQAIEEERANLVAEELAINTARVAGELCDKTITLEGSVTVHCQREFGHVVSDFERHKAVFSPHLTEEPKFNIITDPSTHCAVIWNEPVAKDEVVANTNPAEAVIP